MKNFLLISKHFVLSFLFVSIFVGVLTAPTTVAAQTDTNDETNDSTGKVELYQLAPDADALMQSYVIKTSNGKLIVIDGGTDNNSSNKGYLVPALRAIAGVNDGEYFEVEAWFITHSHSDHFSEIAKMLYTYNENSNYKINNLYFDFPPFDTDEFPYSDGEAYTTNEFKAGLTNYATVNGISVPEDSTYYDELNGAVINSESIKNGLVLTVDDVKFEILMTWKASRGSDVNNQSVIIKMYACDQSVLFLGDAKVSEGNDLLKECKDKLKSDIVQMAHHGQDAVTKEVYEAISANVHLWPTPKWVWGNSRDYTIGETRRWVNGTDFTQPDKRNIVACLYDSYPVNAKKVNSWKKVIDGMKITLPYDWSSDEEETLRMPTFDLEGGSYVGEQTVSISTIEADAEIYYTMDGSFPTKDSIKYTEPIKIGKIGEVSLYNLRAVVIRGDERSKVSTQEYFITDGSCNVALNKPIKVMNYDMTEDWSDQVYSVNKMNKDGTLKEAGVDNVSYINDGSFNKYYVISTYHKYANGGTGGGNGVGWAVIDFGNTYNIDYVRYEAYWDWKTYDHIIQIANKPDFSDAVTIYNNPERIMTGKDASGNATSGLIIPANVSGRYIRVSNKSTNHSTNPMSVFTEIQAYTKPLTVGTDILADSSLWQETSGGTWVHENGVVKQTDPANQTNWKPAYTYTAQKYKNFILEATIKMNITAKDQWGYIGFGLYKPNITDNVDNVNQGFYAAIEPKGRALLWNGEKEIGPTDAMINNFNLQESFNMKIISYNDIIIILINGETAIYQRNEIFNREEGYISIHSGLIPITVSSLTICELDESLIKEYTLEENIVTSKEITQTVANGLTIDEVITALPSTTKVNDTAGKEHTIEIEWTCNDYNSTNSGWYTFVGKYVNLPANLLNVYDAKITAQVFVFPETSTEVKNILTQIKELNSEDYTEDTWNALMEAKDALDAVLAEDYPTQEQVNEKGNQLKNAYESLVKNAVTEEPTDEPTKEPTEDTTKEPTDDSSSKKGCKGSIVASIFGILALAGSVTILRKKRQY